VREALIEAVAVLEAHLYLTGELTEELVSEIQALYSLATGPQSDAEFSRWLPPLREKIEAIRRHYDCRLSERAIRLMANKIASDKPGYAGVEKRVLAKWFLNYARRFPRWPNIPLHARVIFNTDRSRPSAESVLVLEAELFRDVELTWDRAVEIMGDGLAFVEREASRQRDLQAWLRLTVMSIFQCVEAYLNGLAYGCFHGFHDRLSSKEHWLLTEWDPKDNRMRFVPFERKAKSYPTLCAKYYLGTSVDLSTDPDVLNLIGDGKKLRDSVAHLSPLMDERSEHSKVARMAGMGPEAVEPVLRSAVAYIVKVEQWLGRDPTLSVPWLRALV